MNQDQSYQIQGRDQRYRVTSTELRNAWFGTMYLALGDDSVKYACFHFRPFFQYSDETLTKFYNSIQSEIEMLKTVSHPNIFKIIEYIQTQNYQGTQNQGTQRYIIYEYCQGEKLRQMSEADAYPIFLGLAQGLRFIHGLNITHANIVPDNILMFGMVPKYMEFEFAKGIAELQSDQIEKQEFGTPFYQAPEFLDETGHYNQKVDIWALGIIFYKILIGENPWNIEQTTSYSEILNILEEDVLHFPQNIDISERIRSLIENMLEFSDIERISSDELVYMLLN